MKLKNGDPFDIQGKDGEQITFVMTEGTVEETTTNLDGDVQILKQNEPRKFTLQKGKKRKMAVIYVFKASSGESYESHVTGEPGGDQSVDKFDQVPGMADNQVIYRFEA